MLDFADRCQRQRLELNGLMLLSAADALYTTPPQRESDECF